MEIIIDVIYSTVRDIPASKAWELVCHFGNLPN